MDISEINALIDQYGKDIFSFCKKLTYSEHDAEDLYQDTFLKAFESREKIDINNNPKSYLISIAVFLWHNKKRKYARRSRIAPEFRIDDEENFIEPVSNQTPEKELLNKELSEVLMHFVSELDEKMRVPILLFYNAQMSVESIAKVLDCPVGTVKSRLFKAREKLKEKMEVYLVE